MGPALPKALRARDEPRSNRRRNKKIHLRAGFPFDEAWHRKTGEQSYNRSPYAKGVARQFAAIVASGDRTRKLRTLETPTIVIHGTEDPLIPMICGKETASAIPDSELILIEGMGHDLPHDGAWPDIIEAVTRNAKQAMAN